MLLLTQSALLSETLGNTVILRGGKEQLILTKQLPKVNDDQAVKEAGMPEDVIQLVEDTIKGK